MGIKYPCKICKKAVANSHRAVQCDICQSWVHIKCNNISAKDYDQMINSNDSFYCIKCLNDNFPYSSLNKANFRLALNNLEFPINTRLKLSTTAYTDKLL